MSIANGDIVLLEGNASGGYDMNIITNVARGDLIVRGANDWQRLGTGTSGQVLKSGGSGADVSWGDAATVSYASASDVTAGIATDKAITPDALAGSTIFGTKTVEIEVFPPEVYWEVGSGKRYFVIPQSMNGMNLVRVFARCIASGTTGTGDVRIYNVTDSHDMLSTKITIDSTEYSTATAATPPVIDTNYDDVATNDLLRIDIDAVHTIAAKGLYVVLEFMIP